MNGIEHVETLVITDYKKTILETFNNLTEFEIKACIDSANHNPKYTPLADIYITAVERCREILEIILKDK